jgi:hypothetical protein
MTAHVFLIRSLETGRTLGAAAICVHARYASIAACGSARLERRFVPPAGWRAIERELGDQLEPGPLPTTSAVVQALQLGCDQVVQYQSAEPIGNPEAPAAGGGFSGLVHPARVVLALDERLRAAAAAPRLELRR